MTVFGGEMKKQDLPRSEFLKCDRKRREDEEEISCCSGSYVDRIDGLYGWNDGYAGLGAGT